MKLSILIPTMKGRERFLKRLIDNLSYQINELDSWQDIEIIKCDDEFKTTGHKRNILIEKSEANYIAFIDDDDMITDCYIQKQLDVVNSGMDCGSLNGLYFLNGVYGKPFIHSNIYNEWYTDAIAYRRCPNHLNCIRRDIAIQIPYKDITVGEDGNFSMDLKASGLIKTEYEIKETLYLYYDRTK